MSQTLAGYGAFLALIGLSQPVAGATAEERLVTPPLNGFVEVANERTVDQAASQQVLTGESATQWTRMVTTVRLFGMGKQMPTNQFVQASLRDLPRRCPRATLSQVMTRTMPGYQTSMIQVDCPRALGKEPETFIMLALGGGADMHVKQISFRGGRTGLELAWARSFLSGVVLCQPRDRQPACQR